MVGNGGEQGGGRGGVSVSPTGFVFQVPPAPRKERQEKKCTETALGALKCTGDCTAISKGGRTAKKSALKPH